MGLGGARCGWWSWMVMDAAGCPRARWGWVEMDGAGWGWMKLHGTGWS